MEVKLLLFSTLGNQSVDERGMKTQAAYCVRVLVQITAIGSRKCIQKGLSITRSSRQAGDEDANSVLCETVFVQITAIGSRKCIQKGLNITRSSSQAGTKTSKTSVTSSAVFWDTSETSLGRQDTCLLPLSLLL